jgi:uncharacterized protein YgfB (UPF0149 family)|tara:strand:+ start:365 stop:583 length:219 start_codon:yes stop_codon:yes gene_type:complete
MKDKKGVAVMILEKNKPKDEEDMMDYKEALMGACNEFLMACGIELSEDKEEEACEALHDFVQICMSNEDEDY